jgi:hypothetical protein
MGRLAGGGPSWSAVDRSRTSATPHRLDRCGTKEKWVIRWNRSDDFNGNVVDWRRWNKTPENFTAWIWDNESNVSVSDGLLTMT